jgi:ADP-heptose:LPS heptosyltransferase
LIPDRKWIVHELERYADLVRGIGGQSFRLHYPVVRSLSGKKKRNYFVIAPGASHPLKRWPAEHFALLAKRINLALHLPAVIVGSRNEIPLAVRIRSLEPSLPWTDLTGRLDLYGLIGTLSSSQFNITNDAGPYHLSLALDAVTIGIVPGSEFRTYPDYPDYPPRRLLIVHDDRTECFNCIGQCIYSVPEESLKPCLDRITPGAAFDKILSFLAQNRSQAADTVPAL